MGGGRRWYSSVRRREAEVGRERLWWEVGGFGVCGVCCVRSVCGVCDVCGVVWEVCATVVCV